MKDKAAVLMFNNEMTTEVIDELINLVTKYKVAIVPNRNPLRNKEKRKSRRKTLYTPEKSLLNMI